MTYRILVSDTLAEEGLARLREEADVLELDPPQAIENVDAMIVRGSTRVDRALLGQGQPRLKVITRAGVGVDNIDLSAARHHGIIVINTPDAVTTAVTELTFAFLLALARPLIAADRSVRRGEWRKQELLGFQLEGKTLGLIGLGRIGTAVAKRATAFGMQVLGLDPMHDASRLSETEVQLVPMEDLLNRSDFISLHLPLTDQTRGMINFSLISKMRSGVYLINTARGELVEEAALLEALDSGQLAGAALDVYPEEPPHSTSHLNRPNLILSPHIGAQTREAQLQASLDAADETLAALHGEPLRWRVV